MHYFNLNYFSTVSSIITSFVLIFIQIAFKIDIVFVNEIGKIPFIIWLALICAFLLFSVFNKTIKRQTVNYIYLLFAAFSFIYLNSMLNWTVECCPEDYDSMSDWNASKGLSWIVFLPVSFLIVMVQGFIYDFIFYKQKK